MLPTTQFAYRKGLGTCDALLCLSHTQQNALESGQEARIVQIDFNAAFDGVNHLRSLYWVYSVCIRGSVLYILTQFLWHRSQVAGPYTVYHVILSVVKVAGPYTIHCLLSVVKLFRSA